MPPGSRTPIRLVSRRRVVPVLLGLLAVVPSVQAAPDALDVLTCSVLMEDRVAYSGQRRVELYEQGHRRALVEQSLVRAPGGRERIETLAPADCAGRLAVSDGRTLWEYYPEERRCVIRSLPSIKQLARHRQASLARMRKQLRPRLVGTETLLGRKAYHVNITDPTGEKVRECWVDAATSVELRVDTYLAGGGLGSRTYFTRIAFGGNPPDSTFTFRPPAGVTTQTVPPPVAQLTLAQAEQKAGFRAFLPTYLPAGYVLCDDETALLRCPQQGLVLWMVFGNGLDSFSLFQSRCRQSLPAQGSKQVQSWRVEDYLFTVVGQMERSEMAKIRASIRVR